MAVITVSLQIPEELWARVLQSAEHHRVDADDVVYTAVEQFFELSAEDRLAIEEGIRQADNGELIDHEEVVAWFEKKKRSVTEAA
jgi:predicted transcriptional regulator